MKNLSRGSSVNIVTSLEGFDFLTGDGIVFSLPPRPYRLWNPPSLLSNGYVGLFLRG